MKTYMPLDGLRWSRDSGSALCDTPQSAVLGRPGGGKILKLLGKFISKFLRLYYQSEIPSGSKVSGVYFAHSGFCTVVNPKSNIGPGTFIQHGVTIGEHHGKYPSIGRNCFIGARAIIIGGITIGDNVRIGAGAVVVSDIPANCTAVGVPAKIVKENKI